MHDRIYACDFAIRDLVFCFIQWRDHPVHDHIYIYMSVTQSH